MLQHDQPERRKPGTRPKGDRRAITVRVPSDQWSAFDAARRECGYDSLSDYIAALLAEHHGLPVPGYTAVGHSHHQEPLLRAG